MCVLVSSSSLIGQPELISPALDSSGQDWVGYCQKHETPSSLPTRPGVTTAPPPHTHTPLHCTPPAATAQEDNQGTHCRLME